MALTTVSQHVVSVNAIQGTLIADNAITAVHIATNAVSGTLIADNAVTATHIAQNTITVTQLADDAVEADKIADGVITTNHLNKAMISSQTEVTAVAGDFLLIGDTSDSNNLKKIPISGITNLVTSFNADQAQVFNESGNDVDFRIESNDSANMFFLDAGNNKVLLEANNTASVTDSASMVAASAFEINGNAGEGSDILRFFAMADGTGNYGMEVSNSGGNAHYDLMLNPINGGKVVIGDTVSSGVDDLLQIETPASGGGHGIQMRRNDSNGDQGIGRVMFGNNNDTDLATMQVTTDGQADCARIGFFTQPTSGSSTERMRITSAGHVAIAAGKRFYFDINSIANGDTYIDEYSANEVGITTGGSRKLAVSGGNLYVSGSVNSSHNFSDERLKENIVVIPNAVDKVKTLRGITFTRKDNGNVGTGLIAQELEKVLPEAVYKSKKVDSLENSDAEEWKAINYGNTVGLLVEAIKELEARIKELEG